MRRIGRQDQCALSCKIVCVGNVTFTVGRNWSFEGYISLNGKEERVRAKVCQSCTGLQADST